MDATTHMVLFRRATSKSVNKHKFHYLLISQAYGDPALTTNDLRIMIEKKASWKGVTKLVNVETGAEVTDINLRSFLFSVEPKLEVVVTGHCIDRQLSVTRCMSVDEVSMLSASMSDLSYS